MINNEQIETPGAQSGAPAAPTRSEEYAHLATWMRRELWRHDLNKWHLMVLSVLIETTLGCESPCLRVPKLAVLSALTGIYQSHLSKTLADLELMEMIHVRKVSGEGVVEYRIQPNSNRWRCRPLQSLEKAEDCLSQLFLCNASEEEKAKVHAPLPSDWPAN